MQNISGFALTAVVTASRTFPSGFPVTQFADDADPLDSPDIAIAEAAYGLNGHMVTWSRANGLELVVSVIASGEDDKNLEALAMANRVGLDKSGARDVVGIVFAYPDGSKVTASNGVLTTSPLMSGVASSGRYKTKQYRFRFESVVKAGAATE